MSQSAVRFHGFIQQQGMALTEHWNRPGTTLDSTPAYPGPWDWTAGEEQTNGHSRLAIQSVNHLDGQGDFDSKPLLSAYLSPTEMIFPGFP